MVEQKNYKISNEDDADCTILFMNKMREECLITIQKRLVKSLYVYEKSQVDKEYDYKIYVHHNLLLYTLSSNELLNYELTSIIVLLNSILQNEFKKDEFRKTILECKNIIDYLLKKE